MRLSEFASVLKSTIRCVGTYFEHGPEGGGSLSTPEENCDALLEGGVDEEEHKDTGRGDLDKIEGADSVLREEGGGEKMEKGLATPGEVENCPDRDGGLVRGVRGWGVATELPSGWEVRSACTPHAHVLMHVFELHHRTCVHVSAGVFMCTRVECSPEMCGNLGKTSGERREALLCGSQNKDHPLAPSGPRERQRGFAARIAALTGGVTGIHPCACMIPLQGAARAHCGGLMGACSGPHLRVVAIIP